MSKRQRNIGQLAILAIMAGGLLVGLLTVRSTPVYAHVVPSPCDFTTGGGFVYNDDGSKVNFGLVAGCKNPSGFWQGGNIQLHKNNPSTFYNGPTDEGTLCNGVSGDDLGS